jgi:hypothetical protein
VTKEQEVVSKQRLLNEECEDEDVGKSNGAQWFTTNAAYVLFQSFPPNPS